MVLGFLWLLCGENPNGFEFIGYGSSHDTVNLVFEKRNNA